MSLLLLLRPKAGEGVAPQPVQGGNVKRRQPPQGHDYLQEDDELMAWIQTHRPDPLGRR